MNKFLITTLSTMSLLMSFSTNAYAQCYGCDCAPDVQVSIRERPYRPLYEVLLDNENLEVLELRLTDLEINHAEFVYNSLLQRAYDIINTLNGSVVLTPVTQPDTGNTYEVLSPRIVISQADGTVVIDTGLWTGTGPYFRVSTFDNWESNEIGPNQNTFPATLLTQIWPCGLGVQTTFDYGINKNFVSVRLGEYLNNPGSITLSRFGPVLPD